MKKQVQALTLKWPTGIPTSDYERALRLAAEFGDESMPVSAVTPRANEARSHSAAVYVSEEKREKVRQMLSTGRATAQEIADATGLKIGVVLHALKVIGAVDAGRGVRRDGGHGRRPVLWSLPKQRTP